MKFQSSKLGRRRIPCLVAWLAMVSSFSSNGFAADDHIDGSAASHTSGPCTKTAQSSVRQAALSDVIQQNTPGHSQGYPAGLVWDKGVYGTRALKPAPSGFSALTGWGVVYPDARTPVSSVAVSSTVQIADFTTYVHLTNGTWVKVQDQRRDGVSAGHYVADFSHDAHIPLKQETLADGSVSMDGPPAGYNDHFFFSTRGTFTPDTVDGVFVQAKMKTSEANANLVAQLGADWWLNATAQYVSGFKNNPSVGGNNFIKLTTEWQDLYYTSLSPQQLEANPPTELVGTAQSCE